MDSRYGATLACFFRFLTAVCSFRTESEELDWRLLSEREFVEVCMCHHVARGMKGWCTFMKKPFGFGLSCFVFQNRLQISVGGGLGCGQCHPLHGYCHVIRVQFRDRNEHHVHGGDPKNCFEQRVSEFQLHGVWNKLSTRRHAENPKRLRCLKPERPRVARANPWEWWCNVPCRSLLPMDGVESVHWKRKKLKKYLLWDWEKRWYPLWDWARSFLRWNSFFGFLDEAVLRVRHRLRHVGFDGGLFFRDGCAWSSVPATQAWGQPF